MATNGTFYWNEYMTRDAEAAKRFYGEVFGWTFDPMETPGSPAYWVAKADGQPVAGILTMAGPDFEEATEGWFAYVAVMDLPTALARATSQGGEVIREPFDVPGVGRIAIVNDHAGITMGWMTPAE